MFVRESTVPFPSRKTTSAAEEGSIGIQGRGVIAGLSGRRLRLVYFAKSRQFVQEWVMVCWDFDES